MREYVFALEYDPGTNPVADVLETFPDTSIRSLSCHVTSDSLWRVDHASGPPEALEALEAAYLDPTYVADCLVRDDCGAICETQVLDRSSDTLVVYTYWDRTEHCTSVPHIALEQLGTGLLFETYREGRRYRWRIVLGNGGSVREFFETLSEEADECAGIETIRLSNLDPGRSTATTGTETQQLPEEQRRALRSAVEHGYYETPREIDLSELAAHLDIPRSTLSYRLRRAESSLAKSVIDGDWSLEPLVVDQ